MSELNKSGRRVSNPGETAVGIIPVSSVRREDRLGVPSCRLLSPFPSLSLLESIGGDNAKGADEGRQGDHASGFVDTSVLTAADHRLSLRCHTMGHPCPAGMYPGSHKG